MPGANFDLGHWTKKLQKLDAATFNATKAVLAERARSLVVEEFQTSVNPYGREWKASWDKRENHWKTAGQILRDTGRLLNSIRGFVTSTGIRVSTNVIYARTHNEGRGPIPRRQFFPDGNQGLPKKWRDKFKADVDRFLDVLKKGG